MWINTPSSWDVHHRPFYLPNTNSKDNRFGVDFKATVQSLRLLDRAFLITFLWSQHWGLGGGSES